MKCPVCESEMELKDNEFRIQIGYGTSSSTIHTYLCPDCGYDIDYKGNKKIISETIKKTNCDCAYEILELLKKEGKNFSEIERKFNLPSRTLSKWINKKIKPSASAVALLRIIKAFPWMEKIAEFNFESDKAQNYIYNYYLSKFDDKYKQIRYVHFEETKKHIFIAIIDDKENIFENNYIPNVQNMSSYNLE